MDTERFEFQPVGVRADGQQIPLTAEVSRDEQDGLTLYRVTVRTEDPTPVPLARVRLFEVNLGAAAVEVFRGGFYMPSDPAGFYLLRAGEPAPHAGNWKPEGFDEFALTSLALAVADVPGAGRFLAGFTTFDRFNGFLVFDTRGEGVKFSAWCDVEGLEVSANRPLRLEQLALADAADFNAALDGYARHLARIHHARVPAETVTGWIDWQYYREEKTEADVLRSVEALKALRQQGYPLDSVTVDGGWCDHASEWLKPCAKFPSGMAALSERLHRDGFRFGLWFAPYLMNVETETARRHPEWFVIDRQTGEPLHKPQSNVGPCCVLDFSVPEALQWLGDTVRAMVRDWGVDYLKLDGPALAHYRGGRFHDPQITSLQQVRRSLEVIREACGEGVIVEGEGVYGPAIGLVETQRVQQDATRGWP